MAKQQKTLKALVDGQFSRHGRHAEGDIFECNNPDDFDHFISIGWAEDAKPDNDPKKKGETE